MALTKDDIVAIFWRSDTALSAKVRGNDGIADVRHHRSFGWSCSACPNEWKCCHVLAVEEIIAEGKANA
jgi:hypothetical protein